MSVAGWPSRRCAATLLLALYAQRPAPRAHVMAAHAHHHHASHHIQLYAYALSLLVKLTRHSCMHKNASYCIDNLIGLARDSAFGVYSHASLSFEESSDASCTVTRPDDAEAAIAAARADRGAGAGAGAAATTAAGGDGTGGAAGGARGVLASLPGNTSPTAGDAAAADVDGAGGGLFQAGLTMAAGTAEDDEAVAAAAAAAPPGGANSGSSESHDSSVSSPVPSPG